MFAVIFLEDALLVYKFRQVSTAGVLQVTFNNLTK